MKLLWTVVLLAGCYNPNFDGGKLQCSSDGKCPQGYFCASDDRCYKNGTTPPGLGGNAGDLGPTVTATNNHQATAVMAGAVTAHSASYKVIMSTGQGPGGNGTASSQTTKLHGGLVGATQDTK